MGFRLVLILGSFGFFVVACGGGASGGSGSTGLVIPSSVQLRPDPSVPLTPSELSTFEGFVQNANQYLVPQAYLLEGQDSSILSPTEQTLLSGLQSSCSVTGSAPVSLPDQSAENLSFTNSESISGTACPINYTSVGGGTIGIVAGDPSSGQADLTGSTTMSSSLTSLNSATELQVGGNLTTHGSSQIAIAMNTQEIGVDILSTSKGSESGVATNAYVYTGNSELLTHEDSSGNMSVELAANFDLAIPSLTKQVVVYVHVYMTGSESSSAMTTQSFQIFVNGVQASGADMTLVQNSQLIQVAIGETISNSGSLFGTDSGSLQMNTKLRRMVSRLAKSSAARKP